MSKYRQALDDFDKYVSSEVVRVSEGIPGEANEGRNSEKLGKLQRHWAGFDIGSVRQRFALAKGQVEAAVHEACSDRVNGLGEELERGFQEFSLKQDLDRINGIQDQLQASSQKLGALFVARENKNYFVEGLINTLFTPWKFREGHKAISALQDETAAAIVEVDALEQRYKAELAGFKRKVTDGAVTFCKLLELIESRFRSDRSA